MRQLLDELLLQANDNLLPICIRHCLFFDIISKVAERRIALITRLRAAVLPVEKISDTLAMDSAQTR